MEEKLIKENNKIENKFDDLEKLREEFVDKDVFDQLITAMIEVFSKRYHFIVSLTKYIGTDDEKGAEEKMDEIIEENISLLKKWEDFFIDSKYKYKKIS